MQKYFHPLPNFTDIQYASTKARHYTYILHIKHTYAMLGKGWKEFCMLHVSNEERKGERTWRRVVGKKEEDGGYG